MIVRYKEDITIDMTQEETTNRMEGSPMIRNRWQSSANHMSQETLEEIRKCLENPEVKKSNLLGFLIGSAIGSIVPIMVKPFRKTLLIFPFVGGVYGSVLTKYHYSKDCLSQVFDSATNPSKFVVTSREHRSSQLEKPFEIKKGSQMDLETFQQIDQHEEFPSINTSEYQPNANVDILEKNISKGITYDELRQKNRDSYRTGQIRLIKQRVQRSVDSSENQSSQSQDFKSDYNTESDAFPLASDTGKHKTKYGDIWD